MDDFFDLDGRGGRAELEVLRKYCYANIGQPGRKTGGLGQIYFLKFVKDRPDDFIASLTVKEITLRGGPSEGQHQELMAECHSGTYIRISRSNSSDTFQVGADPGGAHSLPVLSTATPSIGVYTGATLLKVFNSHHEKWPRYEQSDCRDFAKSIMDEVQGLAPADDFF
jgi:hypothetical protein